VLHKDKEKLLLWAIPAIWIEEEDYMAGLEDCKNHLHGRIILSKGDAPPTHLDLNEKLQLVWKALGPWKVILLDKGFYEFEFSSLEDMRWVLPSFLKLFSKTKDIVPSTMKSVLAG